MTVSRLPRYAAALLIPGFAGGAAMAQPIGSGLGPEARATIRISVTVRPIFKIAAATIAPTVSSNLSSGVRYRVVVDHGGVPGAEGNDPAAGGAPASLQLSGSDPGRDRQEMLLIVPD